ALAPAFPQAEFARKHEERLHTLLQERDEPRLVANKALQRAIFGNRHPYGQPLNGTVASIQALRREDVISYYTVAGGAKTASFLLAGDIEPETTRTLLEERFGAWTHPAAAEPALPAAAGGPRAIHLIDRPAAPQSEVRIGHVGVPRSTPDYFPLLVMNTILGGSFKSRLNMRLREEKGFTYGASSSFSCRRQSGVFSGSTAVITEATAETVSIFVNEIERMRSDPVTPEELERARNYLALGFMRNFETTGAIAAHLIDVALYDLGPDYLRDYPERVAAVTREDVAKAAGRYLHPDQLSMVVVGDRAKVWAQLHELQLGEVREWAAV
ncbi:MAG TPA: pitrilysin family protein, partial [Longimicrobiales bacterium]|nr:pitrilysin family protein [Longimicrobiales bacterium]